MCEEVLTKKNRNDLIISLLKDAVLLGMHQTVVDTLSIDPTLRFSILLSDGSSFGFHRMHSYAYAVHFISPDHECYSFHTSNPAAADIALIVNEKLLSDRKTQQEAVAGKAIGILRGILGAEVNE